MQRQLREFTLCRAAPKKEVDAVKVTKNDDIWVGVPLVLAVYKRVNYKRSAVTWRNFLKKALLFSGACLKRAEGMTTRV